jgi:hypothetical protein
MNETELPSLGQPPGCQRFPMDSDGFSGYRAGAHVIDHYEEVSKCQYVYYVER